MKRIPTNFKLNLIYSLVKFSLKYIESINLQVEYYGSPVGLKTIAQISTPDSSSFLVQPYDKSRYCRAYRRSIGGKHVGPEWTFIVKG